MRSITFNELNGLSVIDVSKVIDLPIDSIFMVDDVKIQTVIDKDNRDNQCPDCYFHNTYICIIAPCTSDSRQDNASVFFKEIK